MTIRLKLTSLLFILILLGCSSSKELSSGVETNIETSSLPEDLTATKDWHLTTPEFDPYIGTGVEMAYKELLANKDPKQEVIVAIIDSGTDIEHEDLKDNVWVNEDEIAGNGIDDDGNGYIDDMHGWNFIGGPDGTHVRDDTYELTRIYASLRDDYLGLKREEIPEDQLEDYDYFQEIKTEFEAKKDENDQILTNIKNINQAIFGAKQILGVTSLDSLTAEQKKPRPTDGPYLQQAKALVQFLDENELTETDIEEALEQFQSLSDYGLNPDFNPRPIVGDDYTDLTYRFYGNNDVKAIRNDHGTHVAGIVGAVRNNDLGIDGIVNVKLMILRTTPNGDERDKDVANAIRYAAANGAKVMNMSFGKGYSPEKEYVDAAVKFADSLGVLLVSGAGNDATNVDSTESFPNKYYKSGGKAEGFLTVGASSWKEGEELTATFSNYGKENVDIFAPGVEVYSTYPDNEYKAEDGTSMASPVVAGVAALIIAYYPELTAVQVKNILMETSTKPNIMVNRPGSESLVPFSSLSVSGGIVNAYEALKRAEEIVNGQ
ncbi:MAG: S8 family peptidase [Balneolaceae bacterium]|nr:S8 family peptidase [Balneolaceae bacterium]MBO6546283.1 S8 family peptidase [Balneolaceae bacterium]MBO6648642.1 S8 family peptidase [Balneolaceae bacterium]